MVLKFINWLSFYIVNKLRGRYYSHIKSHLGYCGKNVFIGFPAACLKPEHIYMYDNTNIYEYFTFISHTGKLIMKENSGAAQGLTVITGNHHRTIGKTLKESITVRQGDKEKDIIIEEDVWIGANVTLLDGCHIGRGAILGAGSVVRSYVPPYAIVAGNPAKIVGFVFTPDEVEMHENKLYAEDNRTSIEKYKNNYDKYFISRIKEINQFIKI